MRLSQHVLGDDEPAIKWQQPWEYDAWKVSVLKDESLRDEELLRALYAEQWDPVELYKAPLHQRRFDRQIPAQRTRHVTLDIPACDKRIAKAVWVECQKLLARRMTPEARKHVSAINVKMEDAAGITIYR